MRLLLAEDESALADAVATYLSLHHHEVDWADNGLDALDKALDYPYDCILLDIMMPGMDGVSVLKELRAAGSSVPVIFMTAKGELSDKSDGFHAGADDYLTKPFALEELLLRVTALGRRGHVLPTKNLTFADLELDRESHLLTVGGMPCALSPREFQLIEFLILNPNMFFSVDTLLDRVWGFSTEVEINTVWVHISQLRKKLEACNSQATIVSKRSVGYALEKNE